LSLPLPENTPPLPTGRYDLIYLDPPWGYYGDPQKNAAAGKHYQLMSQSEICSLPVGSLLNRPGVVFCWATGPRLHFALEALSAWGLHYRGVAHLWVKTRKNDMGIIYGQGVKATYSKPTTELLLLATTTKTGRPFKLKSEKVPQVVLAPRGSHSQKPSVFRALIEQGYDCSTRLEMFARGTAPPGWDFWGREIVIPGNELE
jgi:N6-adenosine-specific RNA methylase IME4